VQPVFITKFKNAVTHTGRSCSTQFLFVQFRFSAIWHRRSVAALIFCRKLAEGDVTPHHQSRVWIDYVGDNNHVAHLVSS
jgi:hypothetical protein